MNHLFLTALWVVAIGLLTGCAKNYLVSDASTEVEKIALLRPGLTFNQTTELLGSPPQDVAYISPKGHKVVVYSYLTKPKNTKAKAVNNANQSKLKMQQASVQTAEVYKVVRQVYVHFANDTVISVVSTGELDTNETLVFVNNGLEVLLNHELEKITTSYPTIVLKSGDMAKNQNSITKTEKTKSTQQAENAGLGGFALIILTGAVILLISIVAQ